MDHDQQLAQLNDFDQQVLSQPENAQSFATKGFLETLSALIEYGCEKEDDGTDVYKEELKTLKSAIRAFSTVLPIVYKTVCQNEAETSLWELSRSLLTTVETRLVNHMNTGVRITAIKCLQVIVLLFSKASQLRVDHRLLNIQALEKEAEDVYNSIIELLSSDNESVLTATISCLTVIVKKRPQYLKPAMNAFKSWRKTKTKDDSPVMLRNVDKALKLAFVSLIRTESLAPHRQDMITAFGSIGGNVSMFQPRQRQKRNAPQQQHDIDREKRTRTEYTPIIPAANEPNVLANYDITQIPLASLVSLCMTVLQTVPLAVMNERVPLLPAEGVTLAVTRPGFVRSTTPPYPPPPEQPQYNINPQFKYESEAKLEPSDSEDEEMETPPLVAKRFKKEEIIDEAKEDKPKVQVLASVEERASQALKMQPYELASEVALTNDEKKTLLKLSIQRILDAEKDFQAHHLLSNENSRKVISEGTATPTASAVVPVVTSPTGPAKNIWLLLVSKLITRGTNHKNAIVKQETMQAGEEDVMMDEEENKKLIISANEDTSFELKDILLNFIVDNLALRHELALEWLHEEYLLDKRYQRLDPNTYIPSYFQWLHRLLENGIPTLDAKDRILTKLLLDAPELDAKVIDLVKENLESVPERFVPCVSTLRSLVTNRPTVRLLALQVLLDLCTHTNDKMRRTSIVAVKKWNSNQLEINEKVESFAVQALHKLAHLEEDQDTDMTTTDETKKDQDADMDESNKEETKDAWIKLEVVRHAELYFVLCTKRPALLKELFSVYIQASEPVQKYIRLHMINMIKSIGMRSQELIQLIKEFPPGGETLVIRILVILCESKPPTREIVSAVQAISSLAEERSIDLKHLSPILSGQSLAAAAAALPAAE